MTETPQTGAPQGGKRDVVVTLVNDAGITCCSWLISISSDLTPEEALAGCSQQLLDMAIEDGDIEPVGTASFSLREADVELDADLYMQEASEAGTIH